MSDEVSETKTGTPAVEEEAAPTLEDALSEYEVENATEEKKETNDDTKEVVRYIKEERDRRESEQVKSDIKSAVSLVKENLEADLDEDMIEGYMQVKAGRDPRFQQAWVKRGENPKGWESVVKATAKEIQDKMVDKSSTETKNEVVAAVKGATKKTQDAEMPDFNKMSDQDFQTWKMGLK